jgi:hypothetical protein
VDADLQPFSRSCVEAIVRADLDQLRSVATGDLSGELQDPAVRDQLRAVAAKHELSGKSEQIDSTGGHIWLDDIMSKDPYKTNQFFVTDFRLSGRTEVHAMLLVERVGSQLALLGFDLHAPSHDAEDARFLPLKLKGWASLAPFK